MRTIIAFVLAMALCAAVDRVDQCRAQYLYLDLNADAISSDQDRVPSRGAVAVDVWLQTDKNRDGSRVGVMSEGVPMFGYELALRAVGGTVEWGEFANLLPNREYSLGRYESPTELQVGHLGSQVLPPGKYKVGRFSVKVVSGSPRIEFATRGSLRRGGVTAISSPSLSWDGDHYLELAGDRTRLKVDAGEPGDWADVDGLGAPNSTIQSSAADAQPEAILRFGASIANAGSTPALAVTTTREGYLRVRVYDVQGRLVGAVVDRDVAPAGVHRVDLTARRAGSLRLASGIYFYRVEASEGDIRGRFVLLRQ